MATRKQRQTHPKNGNRSRWATPPQTAAEPEVVEPLWLVKAIGLTLVAALVCGYLALCLLFYQGQWQLVLHPSGSAVAAPNFAGGGESVHFGIDESATPQLVGWYLPAAVGARYSSQTVLYLAGGDGQLADASQTLAMLHYLGLNVFAFDYRGYGMSLRANPGQSHPNQQRMTEDAASAWQYLTVSRSLKSGRIIPFGAGVGASLAVGLAVGHPEVPAVWIDQPQPDLLAAIRRDPRTSLLPVGMLFHERFEIGDRLATLKTPKFLVLHEGTGTQVEEDAARNALAEKSADPKFVLSLNDRSGPTALADALERFLDETVHP